jgi:[CysO sulfur-carrier protein]-S-L-cysteine hydrolase
MLKIPEKIYHDIIDHAREGLPFEICGILGGKGDTVSAIYRMVNTDAKSDHFMMDPREQIAVMKDLRAKGLEMTAFYHSHPEGPEYPSAEDIRLAFYPDVFSLIVSLAEPAMPVLKSFKIIEGQVEPVELKLISSEKIDNL